MALPLIILGLLLIIGAATLILGYLQLSQDGGMGFIVLAGIIFMLTGLFLWTQGLESDKVTSFTITDTTITPNYEIVTATEGSSFWVITQILFYGGIILMLVGLGKAIIARRQNQITDSYAESLT